ncbi:uncharacterized protein LOC123914841 [Trifolium pratense]|uniref:uncharacterized protein LOC123914841 n=1 Tax=Trifolium pratense TaxID=57577 RepID=UPI001E694649|nr:uncharacterized protein LOC123914841 [Trifolium pratense]
MGESIPVIRVRNNNHIVTYIKSEHTRGESDLEYYERRYYKRLKDDYYEFKISDSTYRCPFCYNKDYSLSDLLRHAYRMTAFRIFNNANNNNHANNFHLRHIATETLDDNQPSLPEKLDDPAYKSKPKETEVVIEQDASVEVDESKDEKEEIDEHDDSEKEDQTDVESKMIETTINEEGVLNLELEGSFNENNNGMDCDIQIEAMPEIDEETKEKECRVTNLSSSVAQYDATLRITQTKKLMNFYRCSHVMHISSTALVELLDGLTSYYLKLEEKNQAFKEENSRYEARLNEEQKVAIKQTRKNLIIKAEPILSFYYDKRMSQYQDENSGSTMGESIPVIRVRNNNHIVTYIKSEHTRGESDLEYYERRYYKRLKDDYYEFKISDSTYRCPFCYNKDYSLSDLLRHAYRMTAFRIFNNANNNNHANNFHLRHIATETLDDNQPSLPEKLDDPAYKSKSKETEVVIEQDASVEVDESKDEKEEIDEHDDSEKEDQTDVESKMIETTINEEGVLNLELEGSFNENNNGMDCDIQIEAMPEIDEETKEKECRVTNLSSSAAQYDATLRITQTKKLMNFYRCSHVMHISSTALVELLDGLTSYYLKLEEKNQAFKEENSR